MDASQEKRRESLSRRESHTKPSPLKSRFGHRITRPRRQTRSANLRLKRPSKSGMRVLAVTSETPSCRSRNPSGRLRRGQMSQARKAHSRSRPHPAPRSRSSLATQINTRTLTRKPSPLLRASSKWRLQSRIPSRLAPQLRASKQPTEAQARNLPSTTPKSRSKSWTARRPESTPRTKI